MPIGDLYQIRTLCLANTQIGLNVRYYTVASFTGTEATPSQVAQGLDTLWNAAYKALLSVAASWRGVGAKRLLTSPTIEYGSAVNAGAGSVAGDMLPTQCCGLITLYSVNPGRTGRGRVYVPFPSEGDNAAAGGCTAGYVTRLTTLAGLLNSTSIVNGTGGTTSLAPVLRNRQTGALTGLIGGTIFAHGSFATQRRRGNYGKTNLIPF